MFSNIIPRSGVLNACLQSTLLYQLRLQEEIQILNGDGTSSQLNGLLANSTTYSVESPILTNEVDIIRSAIKQVQLADYTAHAVMLNPSDWFDIETRKTGASDDEYVAGNPREMSEPKLWGLPVLPSNGIVSGTFLVGDFTRSSSLFDRQESVIEISHHNDTNFRQGNVMMLASERVGLVVNNAAGPVTGSL